MGKKKSKDDQDGVSNDLHSGRPTTTQTDENVIRVHDVLYSNHLMSVRMLCDTLNILKTIVHTKLRRN